MTIYCIGLTGQLGSGKSTAAAYFAALGAEVINADAVAKALTEKNKPAYHAIVHHFGEKILTTTQELNRRELRRIIFSHPDEKVWLENCLHPLIREEIMIRIHHSQAPYCVIEIPLLTDRTLYPYLNRVILIEAPLEQKITRCMIRDNHSKEDILTMLSTQPTDEQQETWVDDVIRNHGTLSELQEAITAWHHLHAAHYLNLMSVCDTMRTSK